MTSRFTHSLMLSGTVLVVSTLSACGTPQSPAGLSTVPQQATATVATAGSASSNGQIIVKYRSNPSARSVSSLMQVQSIEGLNNTRVYSVAAGNSVDSALAKLRQDPNVAYAEPNYIYHATDLNSRATVNDPMFNQLWGIQKIQAPAAWDKTTGNANVVVAVVDTGVDYNHPDLQGQVIKGPDFVNNDADPMDDQGHGSHVAGTIAALGDNGLGVVGIAYHTKILAIKVLDSQGSGTTDAIAKGILKANELGAKIINLSLGGPQESQTLKDAVDTVTAKGTLCVVAAGNDGNTSTDYPAGYTSTLAVGATDQSDKRTSFSNYGNYVTIAAPGLNILSSTGGSYKQESGTSMASPHVAGAAALLLAVNPALTPDQLKNVLNTTGDPATGFNNRSLLRLNVAKAVASVAGGNVPTPAPTTAPTPAPSAPSRPSQPSQPGQPGGQPGFNPGQPGQPGMAPPPGWGRYPRRPRR